MTCPRCGRENPPGAPLCACEYARGKRADWQSGRKDLRDLLRAFGWVAREFATGLKPGLSRDGRLLTPANVICCWVGMAVVFFLAAFDPGTLGVLLAPVTAIADRCGYKGGGLFAMRIDFVLAVPALVCGVILYAGAPVLMLWLLDKVRRALATPVPPG